MTRRNLYLPIEAAFNTITTIFDGRYAETELIGRELQTSLKVRSPRFIADTRWSSATFPTGHNVLGG